METKVNDIQGKSFDFPNQTVKACRLDLKFSEITEMPEKGLVLTMLTMPATSGNNDRIKKGAGNVSKINHNIYGLKLTSGTFICTSRIYRNTCCKTDFYKIRNGNKASLALCSKRNLLKTNDCIFTPSHILKNNIASGTGAINCILRNDTVLLSKISENIFFQKAAGVLELAFVIRHPDRKSFSGNSSQITN